MFVEILLASAIAFIIGLPIVVAFDKWKKEMEAEDEKGEDDERSE